MAVRTLSIPDEVDAAYVSHNPQNPARAMATQLTRFAGYSPNDRPLILPVETIRELERLAQRTFSTPESLLTFLKMLLTVEVDGINLTLTPGQRARMKMRADFFKRSFKDFAIAEIEQALVGRLGG
jgi:hypothetical protein